MKYLVVIFLFVIRSSGSSSNYKTYNIDENFNIEVELGEKNVGKAIIVQSTRTPQEARFKLSSLDVEAPDGHRLGLFINNFSIPANRVCEEEYVMLSGIESKNWDNHPMCGFMYIKDFTSVKQGKVTIVFKRKDYNKNTSFQITITAFTNKDKQMKLCLNSDYFACRKTDRCIPPEFRCDGYKNCEDGSDENECPKKSVKPSGGLSVGTIIGFMIAVFIGLGLIAITVIYCCKKKRANSPENINIKDSTNFQTTTATQSIHSSYHSAQAYPTQQYEPPSAPTEFYHSAQHNQQGYQAEGIVHYPEPPPTYDQSLGRA